jgi:hypothetical protein
VLSGPDKAELKNVRLALKKCLKTARVFLLEREYLRFVKPDPVYFMIKEERTEDPEITRN